MRISDWSSDLCSAELAFSTGRFRAEREADWIAFDALLTRLEKKGARALSSEELLQLPLLYRATLSSLSIARATSLDKALLDHLEALSMRGYFLIYGRSEEHTSELQSLMRISYAVFCLKKKNNKKRRAIRLQMQS